MIEQIAPIEYDKAGRMKYNPDLHPNQCKLWQNDELDYLINWYSKIGLEEMSLALGRSEGTIATKVSMLRKKGVMERETPSMATRYLRPKCTKKDPRSDNEGRKPKLSTKEIKEIIKLKGNKSYKELGKMFNVGANTIYRAIKKATENPDQSVQSSIRKNTISLYHENRGVQVG